MKKYMVIFLLIFVFSATTTGEAVSLSMFRKLPSSIVKFASKGKKMLFSTADDAAKAGARMKGVKIIGKGGSTSLAAVKKITPAVQKRIASLSPQAAAQATKIAGIGGGRAVRLFTKYGDNAAEIILNAEKHGMGHRIGEFMSVIQKHGKNGIEFITKNWLGLAAGYAIYEVHGVLHTKPGDGSLTGELKKEAIGIFPFLGVFLKIFLTLVIIIALLNAGIKLVRLFRKEPSIAKMKNFISKDEIEKKEMIL